MNCYKCGRFIGPDGDPDVMEVDRGVYEAGYPTCGRCLKRDTSNNATHDGRRPRRTVDGIVGSGGHE